MRARNDSFTVRAAELHALADSAPWLLGDVAVELRSRANLMLRGHDEVTAAAIVAGRHLKPPDPVTRARQKEIP